MGRKENPIAGSDTATPTIGGRLRQLRRLHNMTLQELADRLGYTKPYLSAVENGTNKPSRAILAAYAKAFNVPLAELAGEDDDLPESEQAAALPALDAAIGRIATEYGLSSHELEMIRDMLLDGARAKARALRASLDWWRETGPIPVCCIPVAGWQWREWPFDYIVNAIDHASAEAMQARIRELVIVLPPEKIPEMEQAFRRPPFAERLQQITCVPQTAMLGLGHAILQAKTSIGPRPFAIILPDDRFDRAGSEATVLRHLVAQADHANHLIAVAKLKDNRRQYGVARLEPGNGRRGHRSVELLVEKPDAKHPVFRREQAQESSTTYAVVGRYVLSPSIMTALTTMSREQEPGSRVELLDALQWLIDRERESVAAYVLPSLVQLDRDQTVFVTSSPASPESIHQIA
jgi:dTDP-glucose pyrophosphorylase/transcriptional regulator with XRE-family HTH domain